MLPEISRRCLSCGAAVRAGARFCPQCGQEIGAGEAGPSREAEQQQVEAERADEAPTPDPAPTPPVTPAAPMPPPPMPTTKREAEAVFEAPPTKEFEAFSEGVLLVHAREGAGVEEADAARAGAADGAGRVARVKEHTRARVGRMREEALVVLEEPPDDSGMRFVVLAVVAFLLFVVVLFFSTTVLR